MTAPSHQQTQAQEDSGTDTITLPNFAVGSGSDRSLVAYVLVLDVVTASAPSVSSVVFNTSENFTYRERARWLYSGGDNYLYAEIWTLDNPSNATADTVATLSESASSDCALVVSEYTGANNGVGANTGTYTNNDGNPSCTFTTGSSESLIVSGQMAQLDDAAPYVEGTGTTMRYESTQFWAGEEAASGGSDTIDITHDTARRGVMVAVELQAAAGAPAGQPMSLRATTVPHMRKWTPTFLFWQLVLSMLRRHDLSTITRPGSS